MSYNPYLSSTPPRPFRIIIGALMVFASLIGGLMYAPHEFHKAMVMQGEPTELDWQTLVEQGYGDNPHVRLVNVSIVDPYYEMDDLFADDDLDEMMEDEDLRNFMQTVSDVGPAKVIPLGVDEIDVPDRVVIANSMHYLDEGFRQVDETSSITGMVSTYTVDQVVADFISYCTGEEIKGFEREELQYTIVPIDGTPDLSHTRSVFLLVGLGLSLGLIICGSGGPGVWTIWYAPVPSILSMIGYPMRYGRGGWSTRAVYIAIGAALMGYGYFMMVIQGNLGSANGNPIFQAVGFVSLFTGLGAVLAIPMQITMRALDASVEVQPRKKPVRMSWEQACSMEPVEKEIEYEDSALVRAEMLPLSGELKEKANALEEAGFSKGESMQWQRESGVAAAAVQLGCQSMVVTDLEYKNESDIIECGLISVLGTGMPMITVSANSGVKKNRPLPTCLFQRATSSDPNEMLAMHLESVVQEAEDRDTIVVEIHESEIEDVVQLARRALADLNGMSEGQILSVKPKRYGRFSYPPVPVPDFEPSLIEASS